MKTTALTPSSHRRLLIRIDHLLRNRLWAQVLIALILGIACGLALSPTGGALVPESTANLIATWLALPGRLFLAVIQMVVIPLVLSSIILGIATSGDSDFMKRVGMRIAPYFVCTTVVAVLIGASMAEWLEPGQYLTEAAQNALASAPASTTETPAAASGVFTVDSIPDRIIQIIPTNPTEAVLSRSMFQIVVLAIFLAVALAAIAPSRAKPLIDLCVALQDVSMKVVSWAMTLAPAAVFGLLAQICVQVGFEPLCTKSLPHCS